MMYVKRVMIFLLIWVSFAPLIESEIGSWFVGLYFLAGAAIIYIYLLTRPLTPCEIMQREKRGGEVRMPKYEADGDSE